MPAQNNPGAQCHRVIRLTTVAQVDVAAYRFISYAGAYATAAGGGTADSQGVSQSSALAGEALTITASYSETVEASAAIAFGDWIKPAADGSGRAAVGTRTDTCGRALGAASAAGQLVEVQILRHVQV